MQQSLSESSVTAAQDSCLWSCSTCSLSRAWSEELASTESAWLHLEYRKKFYFVFWCTELPAGWKGETTTAAVISFHAGLGDFTPLHGRPGWSGQSRGGRVWRVSSWTCSADWIYLGLDRVRTVCWKEQCCWEWQPLAGSLPSIPGPVAVGFLLLIWTGVGQFSTSLL